MSGFNAFMGGVKAGRAAQPRRQSPFNEEMAYDTAQTGPAFGARQRTSARTQSPRPQDSRNVFTGLETAQREEVRAELRRKSRIVAALSALPAKQQAIGIQTYGEDFGIDAATLQQAAADPASALATFSSSLQEAEMMLEQVRADDGLNVGQSLGADAVLGDTHSYGNGRRVGGIEPPVTLMAQLADGQSIAGDPYIQSTSPAQAPVDVGGPMTLNSSKLLGPIDMTGPGEDNSGDRFLKEAAKGVVDAAAAPPAVITHRLGLKLKRPRALFVQRAIESGSRLVWENPDVAMDLGLDVLESNPGRLAGRVAGGSAISYLGNKGTKSVLSKAGKSKKAQKAGGRTASALAFSTSQYGAAIRAVNGLIDDLEDAGADLSEISTGTIGRVAIAAAAGGNVTYDPNTGDIILLNSGVEDKGAGALVLGNLQRGE